MKAISLEGLRRFVRGSSRDKNDDSENFKRSNSFKRASLRKSSRRRDLITLPNGLVVKTSAVTRKESVSSDERPDDGYSTDEDTQQGSSVGTRRVISYDEWVAEDSGEDASRNGPTDESCRSTLSTNKLSSLDSGLRHSLDSQKCHRIDSHKPSFQRVNVRNPLSEGPLSIREENLPIKEFNGRKTLDSTFRYSASNGSPVTPSKLKSLLGSPRVAPKHRDPSPCSTKTSSSMNVHTPIRTRLMSTGHNQPMSAPSTPGKKSFFGLGGSNWTPAQQLRSSFHEKERLNVRHGTLPASSQLLRQKSDHPKQPKQSRWSSVFSHPFFSPMKRKQKQKEPQLTAAIVDPPISNVNGSPAVLRQRTLFSCHGSPAVSRQLSVQSAHASPDSRRSVTLRHNVPLVVKPGPNYGVARAIGGLYNCEEFNRRNCASPLCYSSPLNLKRQISTPNPPTSNKSSPALVQRHQSFPQRGSDSPAQRRPLPPIPTVTSNNLPIHKSLPVSKKPLQSVTENSSVMNTSQFYPGKNQSGMVSALPSITIVGGNSETIAQPPSRQSTPDWSVQMSKTLSSDRIKTPAGLSRISMTNFRRPLSLAFNCARKSDLMSPASITSETSSRGGRRKPPGVVVSRASWFSRSSVRKSSRFNYRPKKRSKKAWKTDEDEIPPPPVPVRSTSHKLFGSEGLASLSEDIIFIPPERRRHLPLKETASNITDCSSTSTTRTAHVNLLMPLNQPVGSAGPPARTPKTSERIRHLIAEGQRLLREDTRDTTSEPGGRKFRVQSKTKPTSAPNTTRLNVRALKNPEAILKTFGLSKKTWKKSSKIEKLSSSKDKLAGEIILKQIFSEKERSRPGTPFSQLDTTSHGSEESLVSLVDSIEGNSEFRHSRRLRRIHRKRSQRRRAPGSVSSWKEASRRARKDNGDITQKGYEKKRGRVLAPYITKEQSQGEAKKQGSASPSTRSRRRAHRRVTRNESRYHSEVRQEAVKEALAQYQARPKNLPLPSKRSSVMTARSPDRLRQDSDSDDSDDDSINAGGSLGSSGGHSGSHGTPEVNRPPVLLPPPSIQQTGLPPVPGHSSSMQAASTGSNSSASTASSHHHTPPQPLPPKQQQPLPPIPPHSRMSNGNEEDRRRKEALDMNDLLRNISYSQAPDVTHHTNAGNQRQSVRDDRIQRYPSTHHQTSALRGQTQNDADTWKGTGRWKVSSKIQQLLNTLKRPKRRPLPDFYVDDEEDLEIAAKPKDPNAPKPEGKVMNPARGEQLVIPAGLPRSVEDAVYRYGSSSGFKAPAATVLDANGKLSVSLTYGKLLSRSHKMAYNLLSRLGGRGEGSVMAGDRVALVYPNNDPVSFMCAFYACLQAGLVPVPIEVPLSRRDAGSQQIGFLLGSCGVSVALTSEACYKGLPKNSSGEVAVFKGWPKLNWFITDHLPKPPKDWLPPPKVSEDTSAYIEYATDKDGSVKGVVVPKSALLAQCRTLTSACNYTEGEVAVCVLDFKREVGLWHAILCSVFNGMHVIFIPYSVMKVNPASWMHMITRFKASIAIVKSRDLHWGLLATKDHKDVNLQSLRLLLVADGANPWSLSSCDQFLSVFQSKGLRPDAICPCASSPEALTVSVRRPGHGGASAVGRGVLSMQGLSYGVVRVDQENSLTSLTLQDCGQVLPGSQIVVVKLNETPYLCQTDEVGEICVSGPASGSMYWGLKGLTNSMFRVQPMLPDGSLVSDSVSYVRSGLLGFLGPGGLVFVCGSRDGLMTVTGRKHNTDDIIATVLAVEPMKFIYRGRIGVFSHKVLRDERICVVAEQRPDCSEEESFQWMSRVLQAVDSIHQVGIYCLTLVPPNHLPKTPLGGIHLSETKKKFLEGSLHPANVLMCPHTCVTNLPKPREVHHDVGPASVMVGNLVQGNRLAMAQGRDLGLVDDEDMRRHPQFIAEILKWRASTTENHEILVLMNNKGQVATSMTCSQLHKKAERVGVLLLEKGHVNTGDHVALIYPPGIDLIVAFYGCLYVGAVPVTIRPPHPQNLQSTVNTVRTVVDVSKSSIILSTQSVIKLLKNKEEKLDSSKKWPTLLDTDELPKKKLPGIYKVPTPEMIAFLDFSVSTTGMLAGIKMSHAAATSLCLSMKVACELYPSRVVALCLDPYCGLGLALWVLSSVYSGHQSILIPPSEVETNPALWLSVVSQYKVRDTFCSYGVMELCTKGLGSSIPVLKQRGVNLSCVRTCVVIAEERPRMQLTTSFSKLFNGIGLSPRAVSTSFGCRVNVAICLQGASSPDPSTVYVDLRSLRHDRVTLVERGAPHSLCIMESGKLLPGTKVVIANPDTKGQCSDSHLGEIWVQCNHNATGYFTVYGDDGNSGDHFNSQLVTGSTGEVYARTGYLGFLKRTEAVQADGELHDAVFVVGSLDETIILRGMRYHPIDIETTVMRCHKKIAECAVFTWTNLLVVVVELDGQEYEALDLVPLVTSSVLEEHQVIIGVIVVVDPGVVPINSRGEKQRMHLRDGFLADQLDPIYVAYNM